MHPPAAKRLLRALAWICLAATASCRGESVYRDLAEPIVMEDYLPLSAEVTPDNAALAVRRSLQAHRRSISTPDEQTGYSFRPDGFVQLYHAHPTDRENERGVRTYVAYRSISSVRVDAFFDAQFLKDRFRLILEGDFRRWESHIRVFQPQPDLGAELETQGIKTLTLVLDDATLAQLLYRALLLLSHPKQR
ncbi:MAG TPA: hypothetical protein VMU54_14930 [Planctomycetota bacterium]|nr:hypothetical protein [Planctomycetota bacterium]